MAGAFPGKVPGTSCDTEEVDSTKSTITISRRSNRDIKQREIFVSLDGERLATLMFGDVVTREIAPGHHSIRAHNTLIWKTIEFDVDPGEHARFVVENRPGWGTWIMLSLLGTGPIYLTFEREPSDRGGPGGGTVR